MGLITMLLMIGSLMKAGGNAHPGIVFRGLRDHIQGEKKNEDNLGVKVSFMASKATLLCLRGSRRGKGVLDSGEGFGFSLNELGL